MYKNNYCKKNYDFAYEALTIDDSGLPDEEGDEPDLYTTYHISPAVLDTYNNHLGIVLGVGSVFLVAVAVFGLWPVLGAVMITSMYSLLLGMVGCLAFMGNF